MKDYYSRELLRKITEAWNEESKAFDWKRGKQKKTPMYAVLEVVLQFYAAEKYPELLKGSQHGEWLVRQAAERKKADERKLDYAIEKGIQAGRGARDRELAEKWRSRGMSEDDIGKLLGE